MFQRKNKLKTIDSPVFGYWSALYLSFFSPRLYVDVGKRWRGLGFLYLFFVIALFSIPLYLKTVNNFSHIYQEDALDPLLKIPTLYLQNGEIILNKQMPYKIKNNKNETIIIIDTTGTINDFSKEYPHLNLLINKNRMSIRSPILEKLNPIISDPANRYTPHVVYFDKRENAVFVVKQFIENHGIQKIVYWVEMMLYPLIIAIFFSIFTVFFLVLAFLGQTFAQIFFSFKVGYAASSRMLIVAGTPMLLVLLLTLAITQPFQGSGIILFALLIIYYSIGIFALKRNSQQVARA